MKCNVQGRTDWRPDPHLRGLSLQVPPQLIEAIAQRTVELLAERTPAEAAGYLNVEQAADYIAAPVSRIYDLRRQGLPHVKDGTRLLFRRADLDAHLERGGSE